MNQKYLRAGQAVCLYLICQVSAYADTEAPSSNCPPNAIEVSYAEAINNPNGFCAFLEDGEAVALTNGASMERTGSRCQIIEDDSRQFTKALCKAPSFTPYVATVNSSLAPYLVRGGTSCSPGKFITYQEALNNNDLLCRTPGLGAFDIVRLSNNASFDGPLYGCNVNQNDTRSLGVNFCTP